MADSDKPKRAQAPPDVHLEDATMAAASGMFAHLKALGDVNSTVRAWITGPASKTAESTNDDRDAWMYAEKKAGKTHSQIRYALEKQHPEWDSLDTDQAVGRAIDRYCERKGIPLIRRKQK